jgi:Fe-S-cluster containining protein
MLRDESCDPPQAPRFSRETKCCTYTPKLPPFAVGQLLDASDADQPGRASVLERLEARTGVTPLGVFPADPPSPTRALTVESFGRATDRRCPHFMTDTGQCGIWKFRNSVCSTWFCRHDRGAIGSRFWEAADAFLREVESGLAGWCAVELGLEALAADGDARLAGDAARARLQPVWTSDAYNEIWGDWVGWESEYFRGCALLVAPLDAPNILELAGTEAQRLADELTRAHQPWTGPPPDPLVVGAIHDVRAEPGARCSLITYSAYDRVELDAAILELLPAFDGRPTTDVLAGIADDHGVSLDRSDLDPLIDFAVLVEPK